MIESLFEIVQNPVPGPLDAEFHVLLLAAGGSGHLNPQTILDNSTATEFSGSRSLQQGFYTDIPPRLTGTEEEIAHTIEVAVRRSFDFMKCPVILGGDRSIEPAIIRGIEGQVKRFTVVDSREIESVDDGALVIKIDADNPLNKYPASLQEKLNFDRVKAIVVTGSEQSDTKAVIHSILALCDCIVP